MPPKVQQLTQRPGLQPTVTPRAADSYVRQLPDIVGRSQDTSESWGQLAKALSSLQPSLNRFAEQEVKRDIDDNLKKGLALWQKNRMDWKAFVKAHPEYTGANPHLIRGFKLAAMQGKSLDFKADITHWWEENRNTFDPNDSQAFVKSMNDYAKKWQETAFAGNTEKDDMIMAEGFSQPMERILESMVSAQSNWQLGVNTERAKTELANNINKIGSAYERSAWETTAEITTSAQNLAGEIQPQFDEMVNNGLPAADASKIIINELANIAQDQNNEHVMESLNYIVTARDKNGKPIATLGGGGYGAQVREQVEDTIERVRVRQWNHARQQEAYARQKHTEALERNIQRSMLDNPTADFTRSETFRQLADVDPSAASKMLSFQDVVVKGKSSHWVDSQENQIAAGRIRLGLSKGTINADALYSKLEDGTISYDTFMDFMQHSDTTKKYEVQMKDTVVTKVASDLYKILSQKDEYGAETEDGKIRGTEGFNYFFDKMTLWLDEQTQANNGEMPDQRLIRTKAYELQSEITSLPYFQRETQTQTTHTPQTLEEKAQYFKTSDSFLAAMEAAKQGDWSILEHGAAMAGMDLQTYLKAEAQRLGLNPAAFNIKTREQQ